MKIAEEKSFTALNQNWPEFGEVGLLVALALHFLLLMSSLYFDSSMTAGQNKLERLIVAYFYRDQCYKTLFFRYL